MANPNFSAPERLLEKIDEEFIERVRQASGYKLTRSALIQIFFELCLEKKENLQTEDIFDRASFKEALKAAFKE
jgi:hypothetical protein